MNGNHSTTGVDFIDLPTPQLLSVVGNTANPSLCQLIAPSTGTGTLVQFFYGSSEITFAGFTIVGNSGWSGMAVWNPVIVYTSHLSFVGCSYGVTADAASVVWFNTVAFSGIAQIAMSAEHGSMLGFVGASVNSITASHIGIATYGGTIYMAGSLTISNTATGVSCAAGLNFIFGQSAMTFGPSVTVQSNCPAGQYD